MRQHRNFSRKRDFLKIFEITVIYGFYLLNKTFDYSPTE